MDPSSQFVPVFRPSYEDFIDFDAFLRTVEGKGTACGIVKVIPPSGWLPDPNRPGPPTVDSLAGTHGNVIPSPLCQHFEKPEGGEGKETSHVYAVTSEGQADMSVASFLELAQSTRRTTAVESSPTRCSEDELRKVAAGVEGEYWQSLTSGKERAHYGADMLGSGFARDVSWSLQRKDPILSLAPTPIPGVHVPYLYYGTWRATFAWHTEDQDLYSINYLHAGEPKSWYSIAPADADAFRALAVRMFPEEAKACPEFLRHKAVLIGPKVLKEHGIRVMRAVQQAGEFIITFPRAYHAGFNHGLNLAEAVNFATPRWLPIGQKARACQCSETSVSIDVDAIAAAYRKSVGRNDGDTADDSASAAVAPSTPEPAERPHALLPVLVSPTATVAGGGADDARFKVPGAPAAAAATAALHRSAPSLLMRPTTPESSGFASSVIASANMRRFAPTPPPRSGLHEAPASDQLFGIGTRVHEIDSLGDGADGWLESVVYGMNGTTAGAAAAAAHAATVARKGKAEPYFKAPLASVSVVDEAGGLTYASARDAAAALATFDGSKRQGAGRGALYDQSAAQEFSEIMSLPGQSHSYFSEDEVATQMYAASDEEEYHGGRGRRPTFRAPTSVPPRRYTLSPFAAGDADAERETVQSMRETAEAIARAAASDGGRMSPIQSLFISGATEMAQDVAARGISMGAMTNKGRKRRSNSAAPQLLSPSSLSMEMSGSRSGSKRSRNNLSDGPPRKPAATKPRSLVDGGDAGTVVLGPDGQPIMPILLGKKLRILNMGTIVRGDARYHTSLYIWPVGYQSTRQFQCHRNPSRDCDYLSEILESPKGPIFRVSTTCEEPHLEWFDKSPRLAWKRVYRDILGPEAREPRDGPRLFGLSNPEIMELVLKMPGVDECQNFKRPEIEEKKTDEASPTKAAE